MTTRHTMISEKQEISVGNKSDYTLGKGSRGANSSFSSQSFRGRLMQAHPERHDVLNYYEVLGQLRRNGSTSEVFIVRRRRRPRSILSQCISWIMADNVSLRSAALHAPPLSSLPASQEKKKNKSDDEQEKIYAIKSMRKDRVKNNFYLRELKNEVRLLKHLDHANIVRIYETFEKKKEIHLVLEYCSGGDLHQRAPYTEKDAAKIVKQILSAVKYLHKNRVIHRDLKFENILFESEGPDAEIKLVDFGLSRHFSRGKEQRIGYGGSLYVMAPEVFQGHYNPKSDMWSIGIVAYMLLAGRKPFYGETRGDIVSKILNCHYKFDSEVWKCVSDQAKDFISSLLRVDPAKRSTANQALASSWIRQQNNLYLSSERGKIQLDPKIIAHIKENLERFSDSCTLKKLGLIYIAHRSPKERVLQLRRLFSDFDESQDGMMTFEDFKAAIVHLNYTEGEISKLFKSADMNNSGLIDYTIFIAASLEMQGLIDDNHLRDAFDWLDVDKSGSISKKDLAIILGDKFSDHFISVCFEEIDASRKGKIYFKDFLQLFHEDCSQSTEEWLQEQGYDFGCIEIH